MRSMIVKDLEARKQLRFKARVAFLQAKELGAEDQFSYIPELLKALPLDGSESKDHEDEKAALMLTLHPPQIFENDPPTGIKLLEGYKHKGIGNFEGLNSGKIWKDGGAIITYAIGFPQEKEEAPPKSNFIWYQERSLNGRLIQCALSKENKFYIFIQYENKPSSSKVAYFSLDVKKFSDIADALLMVMPFEP